MVYTSLYYPFMVIRGMVYDIAIPTKVPWVDAYHIAAASWSVGATTFPCLGHVQSSYHYCAGSSQNRPRILPSGNLTYKTWPSRNSEFLHSKLMIFPLNCDFPLKLEMFPLKLEIFPLKMSDFPVQNVNVYRVIKSGRFRFSPRIRAARPFLLWIRGFSFGKSNKKLKSP